MKTLLRCGFVALILLGLFSQTVRIRRDHRDGDPAAALASRLQSLNVAAEGPTASGILTGHSASCDRPIEYRLLQIDGAEDAALHASRQADVSVSYVFLGSVEARPDKVRMLALWVWATVRFAAGLRSGRPPSHFVQVALPPDCPGMATMDWSVLSPWE